MRGSRLAQGGENVLQAVRGKRAAAEAAGVRLLDLSIGEPKGPALLSARQAAASPVMSEEEAMHTYQYNGPPRPSPLDQRGPDGRGRIPQAGAAGEAGRGLDGKHHFRMARKSRNIGRGITRWSRKIWPGT